MDLDNMMRRDYFRLRRFRKQINDQSIIESIRLRESRENSRRLLDLSVPAELPIAEHSEHIINLIKDNSVLILAGETGSGKTTQLPKMCLSAGLGAGAMVGHTQPRRVAARTVAQRLAEETGSTVGEDIGYSVRFGDRTSEKTLVRIMTDGLLLSEISKDRYLDNYDALIVDEAHERSLNIDFLLGYLKRLVSKRSDLKLIITSATINLERFSSFFNDAPIIEIPGRSYPVSVEYLNEPTDLNSGIADALDQILANKNSGARDVLVFLSGEREIFETAKFLRQLYQNQIEVLPLYSRLRVSDQEKIFTNKGSLRRVILATNVAETSVTVPNIGYVVDPGLARVNRYSYRSKLERLPIEPISKASAEQRKGRCGRIAPGTCYRLYDEADFLTRPEFADPEVQRVNLASVLLRMEGLKLGQIESFPFVDPPQESAIRDAYRLLDELGAVSAGKITKVGRLMAKIPLDPRLSRMIVEAGSYGGLNEILIVVSALSVSDPREKPVDKLAAADAKHQQFTDERSDYLSLLKLWRWLDEQRSSLSKNQWRKLLVKQYISYSRVQEWREVYRQLKLISTKELGYKISGEPATYELFHENILVGCLSLVAKHEFKGEYIGARHLKLRVFPGSSVSKKKLNWIVASEITETTRVYARTVAQIDPKSIEKKAKHLVKFSDSEPTWSARRGEVIAYRTVSLYGLRIVEKRAISYGSIAPDVSRGLFISEGLIKGLLPRIPSFLQHNLAQMKLIKDLEDKHRRAGLLVEDAVLQEFYESKIPSQITGFTDLQNWLRKAKQTETDALYFSKENLLKVVDDFVQEDFPGHIEIEGFLLKVSYSFAPGSLDDGVTIEIPISVLQVVGREPFEWLVPGMLESVIESWIRSLPKGLRKTLMPISELVSELSKKLLQADEYRKGRLLSKLANHIKEARGGKIDSDDWKVEQVPEHLRPNFRVVDDSGKKVAEGRDFRVLKQRYVDEALSKDIAQESMELEPNLIDFPVQEIVDTKTISIDARKILVFPGLEDRSGTVCLKAFLTPQERDLANRKGFSRLVFLKMGKQRRFFVNEVKKLNELSLLYSSLGDRETFEEQIILSSIWNCFFADDELPKTAESFESRLEKSRSKLAPAFFQTLDLFADVIKLRFEVYRSLQDLESVSYKPACDHIGSWISQLVPNDFLLSTPGSFVQLLPRYLEGIKYRVGSLPGRVLKDRDLMENLVPLEERLEEIKKAELYSLESFEPLRFFLEEYKLSIFAPALAKKKVNNHPLNLARDRVSLKRVDAAIRGEEQRVGII